MCRLGGRPRPPAGCGTVEPPKTLDAGDACPGRPGQEDEDHGGGSDRLDGPNAHRQGLPWRVQQHPRRHPGRSRHRARRPARPARPRRGGGRGDRLRHAGRRDGPQHRPPGRAAGRPAGHGRGDDGQPLLLIRSSGDRHRRPAGDRGRGAHRRRGRRGVDQPRAERAPEQVPAGRGLAPRAQAGGLHVDAQHRRDRRQALRRHAGRRRTATRSRASGGSPPPSARAGSTPRSCR